MNSVGVTGELRIIPIPVAGEIRKGDSLPHRLLGAIADAQESLKQGDILIVKHKIVSKAEGALVDLRGVRPSRSVRTWARRFHLDPRVAALGLREARRVVRRKNGVLITETRHGFVCANSGVDVSNVDGGTHALLLPSDPDRSAARLYGALKKTLKISVPVIICDSWGRPWREGLIEAAIGVAGMKALHDHRGLRDPHGYTLRVSLDAVADELACAAGLVCGKLAGTPACIVRGFRYQPARGRAKDLLRSRKTDLFR